MKTKSWTINGTWNPGINRVNKITLWLERRQAKQAKAVAQLAFYYAKKSGVFGDSEPCGEWFHLLHNWTLGDGPAVGNVFAHKALDAWNRRLDGHYERKSRVYGLAYTRYIQGGVL